MTNRELAHALRDALNSDGKLPVPLQALVAATLMCARGGAPSRIGMAKTAGYSYGSSQKHYADLLSAIVDKLPAAVAEMTAANVDPGAIARLSQELRHRDEIIANLRQELKARTDSQDQVRRYALALHERLRTLEAQAVAEEGASVSPLHPLP